MQCPVVEYLTYKLQDKNEVMRCFAADALGDIEDARGIEGLAQALKDPDLAVRIAAAKSLWRLGKAGNHRAFAALQSS
jgi:HEAT repeat protein